MADIPVERKEKSGLPWWLIPLLLLLLLPLLFFGFCNRNNTVIDNTNGNANANRTNTANNNANGNVRASNASNVAVVTNTGNANMSVGNSTNNAALNSGPAITDTNFFAGVNDKMTLVGREAKISSVRVNRVLSDRVFTVKSGSSEMFVMLDENLDSPGGKESQIRMKPGQNVNLGGSFRAIPTAEVKNESQNSDLSQKEYAQMKGQRVYLHASSVSDVQ
ncbi:MAG: hypothetical protein M3367_08275 [Acidobacteriota bacterium]|nr:hypothetical protein [Acidobacteriota bacterium]